MAKYEPKTSGLLVLLKNEFAGSRLESVETDPDEWISYLERIRQRLRAMKASIDDDDLIVYVLNNLPKEYDMIVKQLEDDLHHTGDRKLTLERVRDMLRIKFQRIKKGHTDTADNEAALVTHNGGSQGGGGKFKGLCRVCGKYGLKGTDCWSNKSGKGGGKPSGGGSGAGDSGQGQGNNSSGGQKHKFKGKCFFCGYVVSRNVTKRKDKRVAT